MNSFYGLQLDANGEAEPGRNVLKMEREFNTKAGFSAEHDRLPRFLKNESLPPHNVVFEVEDEQVDSLYNW